MSRTASDPLGLAVRALWLLLALAVSAPAAAQVGSLKPVDEAAADPSFVLFRARLVEAVATRDTAFVLAHLDPHATLSFGGHAGAEGFRDLWLGDHAGDLWTELARFLPFGSTYAADKSGVRATIPYWFGAWPEEVDAFEHMLMVGEDVNVRAEADGEAPVLTRLSHTIVPTRWSDDEAWVPVTLTSGEEGYVARRFVRSPVGYRMGFVKEDGRWRITFFVAGD